MKRPSSGVLLAVRVQPRAKREGIQVAEDGAVAVRVSAPAEKGKANRACVELLARALGVGRGAIALLRGHRSREKTFAVEGMSQAEIERRLRAASLTNRQ